MELQISWEDRMAFTVSSGGLETRLDARPPFGKGEALGPKELVLAGLCGCTAMDVVGLLRRQRQELAKFDVLVRATQSDGQHPKVFTAAHLELRLQGEIDPQIALDAVRASQTLYCGVSAMLSRAFPITYEVWVNGVAAGTGQADYSSSLPAPVAT